MSLAHIKEGLRMLDRRIRFGGFREYSGNAKEICKKIVRDCWNSTYFQTSAGHFTAFYIRDFCIAAPGLMRLGYQKEVWKTLQYALNIYSGSKILATTITQDHKPVHMFSYSPDSLPMLLRSIRIANATELIEIYEPFLEQQVQNYYSLVFDPETQLINELAYSSMKDNHRRASSCYDNCMLSMLSDELEHLRLANPFRSYGIKKRIMDEFYNGNYFYDDMKKKKYVAGDANTFPFWCGVTDDKEAFSNCLKSIQKEGLDRPMPLKYTKHSIAPVFPFNILLPDYEKDTVWLHLGLCFLDVVEKFDKKLYRHYREQYTKIIEKHRTFPELLDANGKIFKRLLYVSDEGMVWAARCG